MGKMTFGVCLHFEDNDRDVWSGRAIDLDAWRYALKAFGGDRLAVVNLSEAELSVRDESIVVEEHPSFDAFTAAHEGECLVCVELGGPSLVDFTHPAACWYVFGGTTATLPRADVSVPTRGVVLHPVHVQSIVLWDRHCKGAA